MVNVSDMIGILIVNVHIEKSTNYGYGVSANITYIELFLDV